MKLGCSKEDKNECKGVKRGEDEHFTCYCKSDFCNRAPSVGLNGLVLLVAVAMASMAFSDLRMR